MIGKLYQQIEKHPMGARAMMGLASLFVLFIIGLGAIWPSAFTYLAIFSLPAFLVLIVSVFRPKLIIRNVFIFGYVTMASILCVAGGLGYLLWALKNVSVY